MSSNWEKTLKERLPFFGHRNWLVIADAAYPAQSSEGIEILVADEEQTDVLSRTLGILNECKHIKPKIYTDAELSFVPERHAPGISSYRKHLETVLNKYDVHSMLHEEIIARLDRAGEMFRVLLIKTNTRIPYTSVFFELECGYWDAKAEDRLRAAMRAESRDPSVAESLSR
jgi:L-fucose mutarotase/ribose pyranase (RbsD/FucU family)